MLVVTPQAPRWRQLIEGDVTRDVRRRIGKEMAVEGIAI